MNFAAIRHDRSERGRKNIAEKNGRRHRLALRKPHTVQRPVTTGASSGVERQINHDVRAKRHRAAHPWKKFQFSNDY